jgi:hypothetical protein
VIRDVTLGPSGTVEGIVWDGQNPASNARVTLRIDAMDFERTDWTGTDGQFTFEEVAVGSFTLSAESSDWPSRYSEPVSGEIAAPGETWYGDLVLGDLITISGKVYSEDGTTPVSSARVQIEVHALSSYNYVTRTNYMGYYTYPGLPPGPVTVWANHLGMGGSSAGVLQSGQSTTLDITLSDIGLSATYMQNLGGADGFIYDITVGGILFRGGTADGRLAEAYNGTYSLSIDGHKMDWSIATLEDSGREVVIGPQFLNQLEVTRKVFVPAEGGFARYLDIIYNPGNDTTMSVNVEGDLASQVRTTPSVQPTDTGFTYAVTYDSDRQLPALAHVFGGPVGSVGADEAVVSNSEGVNITYSWNDVPVGSGETVCFLHFSAQREPDDEAGAAQQAEALVNLTDPSALSGMSPEERDCVVNFTVP